MSPLTRRLTITLAIAAAAGLGVWLVLGDFSAVMRKVGLESVLLRTSGGPSNTDTTDMRPTDVRLEAYRADTKRVDRWLLRMPAAFVVAQMAKSGPRDTASYYLEFVLGSDEPGPIWRAHKREQMKKSGDRLSKEVADPLIVVRVQRALARTPTEVARELFRIHEAGCRNLGVTYGGLVHYEKYEPSERATSDRTVSCVQGTAAKYMAGKNPGQYDLSIVCQYARSDMATVMAYCQVETFIMHGWGVQVSRFDPKHLPRWREVVRQVVSFLDKHTVESTTGLPSTDLDWL
jgi:hypothetical protein